MAQKVRNAIGALLFFAVAMNIATGGDGDFGLYVIYILVGTLLVCWERVKTIKKSPRRIKHEEVKALFQEEKTKVSESTDSAVEEKEGAKGEQKKRERSEADPNDISPIVTRKPVELDKPKTVEEFKSKEGHKPKEKRKRVLYTARAFGEQARFGERFPIGVCGLLPLLTFAGSSSTCWVFPDEEVYQLETALNTVNGVLAETSEILETSQFEPVHMFWIWPDMESREDANKAGRGDAWWQFTRVEYNDTNENEKAAQYPVKLRFYTDAMPWSPYSYWGFIHYSPDGNARRVELYAYLDYYGYKIYASMVRNEELSVKKIEQITIESNSTEVYKV